MLSVKAVGYFGEAGEVNWATNQQIGTIWPLNVNLKATPIRRLNASCKPESVECTHPRVKVGSRLGIAKALYNAEDLCRVGDAQVLDTPDPHAVTPVHRVWMDV